MQAVKGVRGRAVTSVEASGHILLSKDPKHCLNNSRENEGVTLSLWLLYESKGVFQTFLAAGQHDNGDKEVHLYQRDGSKEELTFSLRASLETCFFTFCVPQQVWTQLVFTWLKNIMDTVKVYRNGEITTNVSRECQSVSFSDQTNRDINITARSIDRIPE